MRCVIHHISTRKQVTAKWMVNITITAVLLCVFSEGCSSTTAPPGGKELAATPSLSITTHLPIYPPSTITHVHDSNIRRIAPHTICISREDHVRPRTTTARSLHGRCTIAVRTLLPRDTPRCCRLSIPDTVVPRINHPCLVFKCVPNTRRTGNPTHPTSAPAAPAAPAAQGRPFRCEYGMDHCVRFRAV